MIGAQLHVTEARHRLARKIFFGQRGELRQHYREGMEDRLGALGLGPVRRIMFSRARLGWLHVFCTCCWLRPASDTWR
jgi:hypothetical protein